MKQLGQRGWVFLSLFAICSLAYKGYHRAVEGFKLENVWAPLSYDPAWAFASDEAQQQKVDDILAQPFTYLGKGGQAYAFESADGKYVIKFLRVKYLKPKLSYHLASFIPFLENQAIQEQQRRYKKFYQLFQGYKLAYELNREESGLIFLHFNPTYGRFGALTLYDKLGRKLHLELDQIAFILQEKGVLLEKFFKEKLSSQGMTQGVKGREKMREEVKAALNAVFDAIMAEYQQGLFDRDYGRIHNTALVGLRPIHIDLGKVSYDPKMREKETQQRDLELILAKLDKWLHKHYPEERDELIASVKAHLFQF